ncbi:UDP-N-acetylmuramyl pentapeptide phosphotransferase/UDP-N-acetylglucosamine-1-phosphate transferase [Pedobacter westerhofensis]|uniref:UDP-N-acetylmuramyl pentapeptide phosphotransferase/UDP-N-acetylglucosamine-1-phosphate transferase n=1 Tax=Pedobacter westerhofensis TaxID=425512 RepID=A0A521C907_9SPHI|nr:glycosyltransferase family 4 protein [Pedobacter westerhofensis]SMO55896.1 UDP-N-acetylmuramyl pentapeptide phosphotransferase/UDP-N-acetylglucosamine-1-phosphate transferase [Pedobacter westerhofensis]
MTISLILIMITVFIVIELLYFKLATYYNIIDQPNIRSSHTDVTIRGGGIIFPLALLAYFIYFGTTSIYFLCGLFLISIVSFADDIKPVNNKLRLIIHLISVGLLFYELHLFSLPWYMMLFAFFFAIGTINAVNFMDGINGITGGYSLITLITLWFINTYMVLFTDPNLILITLLSVAVFTVFNFRKKALCFAGDIGSVSIGFILVYFILALILKTQNLNYILLLLAYGLDVVTTVIFRFIRKENVLEAHRTHFYQYLSNNRGITQLRVSLIYILLQFVVNLVLIFSRIESVGLMITIMTVSGIVFVKLRFEFEGTKRLLG